MPNTPKSNSKKSNTTSSPDKLAQLKERRKNRGTSSVTTDYDTLDADLLRRLIATVAQHGTITFGYTRDGGAYYINYWVDGESIKEYVRPTEDVNLFLQSEIDAWSM